MARFVAVGLLLATAACSSPSSGHSSGRAIAVTTAKRPSLAMVEACVAKHPASWMGCLVGADPSFGRFPISALALPGSRNAGTYNLDPESFDTAAGSSCTSFTARDATLGPEFVRWSETQDETITEQLDQGIRFVELQVAYNGDGSATKGWRVVQSLYSDFPLYDYLDQVAIWAASHPSEAVVVDLSRVCYDNGARGSLANGLWTDFSTPSDIATSRVTMARVAFDPATAGSSVANATIDEIARKGHNVVVLVPGNVVDLGQLETRYKVHPVVVGTAHNGAASGSPTKLEVESADAQVAPVAVSAFASADAELRSFPLSTTPAFGSLVGKGLYVTQLAYSVTNSTRTLLFRRFGGLITSASVALSKHHAVQLAAWEAGLWGANTPRNQILAAWGHRANIVLADGVEYGGYVTAVVALNAK